MATYSAVTTGEKDADSPVNVALVDKLDQNPHAIAEGASGAPKIQDAAFNTNSINGNKLVNDSVTATQIAANAVGNSELANDAVQAANIALNAVGSSEIAANAVAADEIASGAVGESEIAAGAVHQAELQTGNNETQYILSTGSGSNKTLPGGEYGFYPRIWATSTANDVTAQISSLQTVSTTLLNSLYMYYGGSGSRTLYGRQRYMLASPPFDLGDGEIPFFLFLEIKNGKQVGGSSAQVPPWAYNGPTDIVGNLEKSIVDGEIVFSKTQSKKTLNLETGEVEEQKIEITQELKNRDMPLIPHPFPEADTETTVILLDPCESLPLLDIHETGESVLELITNGYIKYDNTQLNRKGPPGVMCVDFSWRNTRKKPAGLKRKQR